MFYSLFSKKHQGLKISPKRCFYLCFMCFLLVSAEGAWGATPKQALAPKAKVATPEIRLKTLVKGLNRPLALLHAKDGSDRLFIVEQSGLVKIFKDGKVLKTPFLDIRDRVTSGGEKGLLGFAFHPDFSRNRRFFVNYTESKRGLKTVISEFTADKQLASVNPASERKILSIAQPFGNHNGGQIAFGPDGYLYIGTGDGGAGNDPKGNGQKLSTLLGKILRIDIDRKKAGKQYAVPSDNPFTTQRKIAPEIWAYGFRNPWRFSFDAQSGALYVGDVGQNHREEIDLVERGGNYGWRLMEGNICTPRVRTFCDKSKFRLPLFDYPRSVGTVVIGGYVYRGRSMPNLQGAYIFGDFGNGRIWMFRLKEGKAQDYRLLLESDRPISAFAEDEKHELYVIDYSGSILKISSKDTDTGKALQ